MILQIIEKNAAQDSLLKSIQKTIDFIEQEREKYQYYIEKINK